MYRLKEYIPTYNVDNSRIFLTPKEDVFDSLEYVDDCIHLKNHNLEIVIHYSFKRTIEEF